MFRSLYYVLLIFLSFFFVETFSQSCTSLSGNGVLYNNGTIISSVPTFETRILKTQSYEYLSFPSGGTVTLFTDNNGPGNVEYLSFDIGGCANSAPTCDDSYFTITVDGVVIGTPAAGLMFLSYDEGDYTVPYFTNDLTLSYYQPVNSGGQYGGTRALFLPYQSSCSITLTNAGTASATLWTTIEYRNGGFPNPLIYGAGRIIPHMSVVNTAQGVNPAAYAAVTLLPTVTGKSGVLDTIQMWVRGSTSMDWVAGDPTILVDGTTYEYGGTGDFFGAGFALTLPENGPFVSNKKGITCVRNSANPYQFGAFRFFSGRDYFPFNNSISVTFYNGQSGQSTGPSDNFFSYLVIYYTTT